MDLKTLGFNRTLLKKDWKMTKWIALLVTAVLFFTMTLGIINVHNNYKRMIKDVEENPEYYYEGFDPVEYKDTMKDFAGYRFKNLESIEMGLIFLVPIALAALLFGEEKRRKTFEVLASMPFTRWEIFFNKLLVAITNIILPILINATIMIIALGISKELRYYYSINLVILWLLGNVFRLFVVLGFSFLFATLTGTTIAQVVLTAIFIIFPLGFTGLIGMNMSVWGYNFVAVGEFIDNLVNYTISALVFELKYVPIAFHLVSGIVMFLLSKVLFDRNRIERSGETLEFESLENFFKIGVTICVSLLSGVIFYWIGDVTVLSGSLWIIIGYVVGLFLGWIIATYSIKLNRSKA